LAVGAGQALGFGFRIVVFKLYKYLVELFDVQTGHRAKGVGFAAQLLIG
jgi:hypothetical protein